MLIVLYDTKASDKNGKVHTPGLLKICTTTWVITFMYCLKTKKQLNNNYCSIQIFYEYLCFCPTDFGLNQPYTTKM